MAVHGANCQHKGPAGLTIITDHVRAVVEFHWYIGEISVIVIFLFNGTEMKTVPVKMTPFGVRLQGMVRPEAVACPDIYIEEFILPFRKGRVQFICRINAESVIDPVP